MTVSSYMARLKASGNDTQEAVKNISSIGNAQEILNSPSRSLVKHNDVEVYSIVSDDKKFETRRFLFVPETSIYKGEYIVHQDLTYLVTEHTIDDLYPQATGKVCNFIFPVKVAETKVIVGYNGNRPIYDTVIETVEVASVFTNKTSNLIENQPISLPDGVSIVLMPYDPTGRSNPKVNDIIKNRNAQYKVIEINYENVLVYGTIEKGYIEIRLQKEAVSIE